MKPLIVLNIAFAISLVATKILHGKYQLPLSGRVALSVMLIFTAVAHFAFTKGMEMMLPSFIPFKTQVVYLTGLIEIAAAVGLFFPGETPVTMKQLEFGFRKSVFGANTGQVIKPY